MLLLIKKTYWLLVLPFWVGLAVDSGMVEGTQQTMHIGRRILHGTDLDEDHDLAKMIVHLCSRYYHKEIEGRVKPTIIEEPNKPVYFKHCGGTLIHPEWVLTAAHCFDRSETDYPKGIFVDNSRLWDIQLGTVLRNEKCKENLARELYNHHADIQEIVIHPKYKERGFVEGYDIALVKLTRSVKMTKRNQVANLLPEWGLNLMVPRVTETGDVAGWGKTSLLYNNTIPEIAQTAKFTIRPSWCVGNEINETLQFCANQNTMDPKNMLGDGGSGFMVKRCGKYYVEGIASGYFKNSCGLTGDQIPIFTRVTPFIKWIWDTIAKFQ